MKQTVHPINHPSPSSKYLEHHPRIVIYKKRAAQAERIFGSSHRIPFFSGKEENKNNHTHFVHQCGEGQSGLLSLSPPYIPSILEGKR